MKLDKPRVHALRATMHTDADRRVSLLDWFLGAFVLGLAIGTVFLLGR